MHSEGKTDTEAQIHQEQGTHRERDSPQKVDKNHRESRVGRQSSSMEEETERQSAVLRWRVSDPSSGDREQLNEEGKRAPTRREEVLLILSVFAVM